MGLLCLGMDNDKLIRANKINKDIQVCINILSAIKSDKNGVVIAIEGMRLAEGYTVITDDNIEYHKIVKIFEKRLNKLKKEFKEL